MNYIIIIIIILNKHLILKENKNFSYLWKFEPDIPNSFREILF